jgi:hypothetical protein
MRAQFDSESVTVHQTEYISFEHFQDQTCKIYEILWKTFEVERILGPTFQAILQIGFDELADASAHTLKMGVCEPEKTILDVLEGQPSTVAYTLCTETDAISDGNPVVRRRRLDFRSVRQERQPDFDERVIRRLPLLPVGQQKALGHLMQLRRRYPKMHPAAVQFDLETALEGELLTRTFDLSRFFNDSWEWIGNVRKRLQGLPGRRVKGER